MATRRRGLSGTTKLVLLGLALAGGWAWWYYAPRTLPAAVRERLPVSELSPAHNPALYKWQDDQGTWHVTDKPPEGRPYTEERIDPNTNVLPSGVPPERD